MGFDTFSDRFMRCGRRSLSGLKPIDRFALLTHGPWQLLRAASVPS